MGKLVYKITPLPPTTKNLPPSYDFASAIKDRVNMKRLPVPLTSLVTASNGETSWVKYHAKVPLKDYIKPTAVRRTLKDLLNTRVYLTKRNSKQPQFTVTEPFPIHVKMVEGAIVVSATTTEVERSNVKRIVEEVNRVVAALYYLAKREGALDTYRLVTW